MQTLLFIFLGLVAIKMLLNGVKYFETRKYLRMYTDYVFKCATQEKVNMDLIESKAKIISLFKGAGIKEKTVPLVRDVGYGQLQASNPPVFTNMQNIRSDIVDLMNLSFHEAMGVYKGRAIEAINPIYWIEAIIYMPRTILSFLGVSGESIVIKVLQIVWWFIGIASGFLYAIYRPDLEVLVRNFFSSISK